MILQRIKVFFLPIPVIASALQDIASELRIIREMYELELSDGRIAEHKSPLVRVTEDPKKSDTTVTFGEDETETKDKVSLKSRLKAMMEDWDELPDSEETDE